MIIVSITSLKARKFNRVFKNINLKIASLQNRVVGLESRMDLVTPSYEDSARSFLSLSDSHHYNIIFIGNSITRHEFAKYWWSNKRGMTPSAIDNDFFHRVVSLLSDYLLRINPNSNFGINFYATNYSVWETQTNDRAKTFPLIDKYLVAGEWLDCVAVQLGENVNDTSTIESDFTELLNHLHDMAPNARLIVIENFWRNDKVDTAKLLACKKPQLPGFPLMQFKGNLTVKLGWVCLYRATMGKTMRLIMSGLHSTPVMLEWHTLLILWFARLRNAMNEFRLNNFCSNLDWLSNHLNVNLSRIVFESCSYE